MEWFLAQTVNFQGTIVILIAMLLAFLCVLIADYHIDSKKKIKEEIKELERIVGKMS